MKGKPRVLSRSEVEEIVGRLERLRDQALISFLYLTGARISEALEVRAEDFRIEGDWLLVELVTLKRRDRLRREVPIPLRDPLSRYVVEWVRQVGRGRLWPFTRRYALMILKSARPDVHLHELRHTRLTELVREYDFNEYELMRWTGWKTSKVATEYIKLKWRDLVRKLQTRGG